MQIPAVKNLLDFTGKTVIVTGGGSGLGQGIATRFAEAGASVVVHYGKSKEGADRVVASIRERGGRAVAVQADVTKREEVTRLLADAVAEFGRVDVLVNNAGIYPLSPLLEIKDEEWRAVIDANLTSLHVCTQLAASRMIEQSTGGAIVNIASIEGLRPMPMHAHYTSAKAAVIMHTQVAAQELGRKGIRVNAVSPGLIWREGLEEAWPEGVNGYIKAAPLGRLGRFEDVADACLFLASDAARWITGANLVVDGGVLTNRIF